MNQKTQRQVVRLIIVAMIINLLIIGYVFFQSYQGRADVVQHSREGCQRALLDRKDNAIGWRIAEAARRAAGELRTARSYELLARHLEARANINCNEAFPKAGFFP
jgi:hypothetical protein